MRFIAHLSIWALAQGGAGQEPPSGLSEPRTIEAVDTVFTEEMTWMEVRDAIAAGKTTILVGTGGLEQNGFRDIVLIGDSGGNLERMEATAAALNARWAGGPARVYHIREYYEQYIWSYDELKRMGIVQRPDVKSASRAGVHTDFHYESIVALVSPALIRRSSG
jgi:hypothetical protein